MKQRVKLDVYNHFKLVDSFYYEYSMDIEEEIPSISKYVNLVNDRKYYPYDTIDIDNGRVIIIPVMDGRSFIMSRNVTLFKEKDVTEYTDFYIVDGNDMIDLINE